MQVDGQARRDFLGRLAEHLRRNGLEGAEVLAASHQGQVARLTFEDRELAIKSPTGNRLMWRLRRLSLEAEYRAYRRLDGVPGVVPCLGLVDRRWLVLDYVAGRPFRDAVLADRQTFFDHLLQSIRAMHARGVAHADLKRKANLRVGPDGRPVILDLGAAVLLRPGFRPLNRRLFRFACQTDLNAWIKLKYGGYENVAEADRKLLRRSLIERALGRARRAG